MRGISDKALNFGNPENKRKKFQGQEYNDDLGVDIYEFKYRMDDPQIGRFWQVDPLASEYDYNSTYAFSEDKVIAHVELEGLEAVSTKDVVSAIATAADRLNLGTRLEGVGKVITGAAVMATGVATLEVPMIGVPIFLEGSDIGGTGLKQIWTGKSEESLSEGVMQDLGVPKEDASNISFLFGGVAGLNPFAEEVNVVTSEVRNSAQGNKALGKYSDLQEPKTVGPGLETTKAQRQRILNANKEINGGVIKSDKSGKVLDAPVQSKKGVPANMNQAEIDHIDPKSKGGSNSNSNLQVLSKEENLKKRDN